MAYGVRKQLKSFVNVPRWMGAKDVGRTGHGLFKALKSIVAPAPKYTETFEEACKRMNLDVSMLKARQKAFLQTAMLYLAMALGMIIYAIYLMAESHWHAAIISLSLTVILLTFAFREHFWYTQMKNKRLGMSVQDWLNATFGGK